MGALLVSSPSRLSPISPSTIQLSIFTTIHSCPRGISRTLGLRPDQTTCTCEFNPPLTNRSHVDNCNHIYQQRHQCSRLDVSFCLVSKRLVEFAMLTHVFGSPSASGGSQSAPSNDSSPSTSTPPRTENFHAQLDDYLLQNKFDDGTLHGRISDDPSSPSDLEAAYEARAHANIEDFNADFHNTHE